MSTINGEGRTPLQMADNEEVLNLIKGIVVKDILNMEGAFYFCSVFFTHVTCGPASSVGPTLLIEFKH